MIVTKDSVRKFLHRKRLPKRFFMLVPGCWILDVLRENSLEVPLWSQTYWITGRSKNQKQLTLTWKVEK